MAFQFTASQRFDSSTTPLKHNRNGGLEIEHGTCPYGSPVSGLCSSAAAPASAHTGDSGVASHLGKRSKSSVASSIRTGLFAQTQSEVNLSPRHGPTATLSWAPGSNNPLASSTSSMPELWQRQVMGQLTAAQQTANYQPHTADSTPSRDQQLRASQPHPLQQQQFSTGHLQHQQQQAGAGLQQPGTKSQQLQGQSIAVPMPQASQEQTTATAPVDILLAPLLPSADEAKVLERLSQLRHALDEQRRRTAGWEQQAVTLQQAYSEGQHENLTMRGQLVALQHNINLLGGNLQGRLSMVQGAVLAQLQTQLAEKDSAIAASEQRLTELQAELERLSCGFASKLSAEQAERERLSAEASQARLLCQARGRQVTELQQEVQQLQQAATSQQQTASVGAELQQQQLEQLHQRVQELQQELSAAKHAAADAAQHASSAEGGRMGLRQQVAELQSALAEKQLQIEWLEGKVADLESSDMTSQMKRHSAEVARLQSAAAAERQSLEQQLTALRSDLAALQQQDAQRQQQLEQLEQDNAVLQQQLNEQQSAQQQIMELQRLLQDYEAEIQRLQSEVQASAAVAADGSHWQDQQQQQQQDELAAAMASDSEGEDSNPHDRLVISHQEGLTIQSGAQSRPSTPAAAALEHALRAELGIANAEVARLRHELDVAQAARSEERQLTGAEIMRLQQELSEAAASASSTGGAAAPAAGGEAEVTSQLHQCNEVRHSSSNSWHSVHDNPAYEQQQQAQQLMPQDDISAGTAKNHNDPAGLVEQYKARLQDQTETITSLQQQLKQQQHLLAALRKQERRVHDSAASKSSWVDMLGPDDDSRQLAAAAAAGAAGHRYTKLALAAADAAVQTDGSPTESAGSTAAAPVTDDEQVEFMSPRHPLGKQQRHGGADVWCEGAAGSALLSAARQEIQRLQELNQQLLQSHAEDMKSSVSFEAARRALTEAKAHAKSKAAAVLQTSNKAWQEKLAAAKDEKQQLLQQLDELKQQGDQLQQQARACGQYEAAVGDLQLQLDTAHAQIQHLQRQIADLSESHAQELEQLRIELETEAAVAMLDAGAAAVRRSMQQQQQLREAAVQVVIETAPLLLDAAVQTDQQQQQWQPEVVVVQQVLQQLDKGVPLPPDSIGDVQHKQQQEHLLPGLQTQQQTFGKAIEQVQQETTQVGSQEQQQQLAAAAMPAERPSTPQPAPETPAAAAATAAGTAADSSPAAAVPLPTAAAAAGSAAADSPAAADGLAAASSAAPAAAFVQHWHDCGATDDDMCRMSSASDTPASNSSKLHISRMRSSGSLATPPPAAAAAADGSSSSEFGDCSSSSCGSRAGSDESCKATRPSSSGVDMQQAPASTAAAQNTAAVLPLQTPAAPHVPQQWQPQTHSGAARPSSAGSVVLPELQTSASPVAASSRPALRHPQQQHPQQTLLQQGQQVKLQHGEAEQQQEQQAQQQESSTASSVNRLSSWHVELLQQQAQLDQLRLRLSQHKPPTAPQQQMQQPVRKFSAGSSYLDRQVSPQRFGTAGSSSLLNSSSRGAASLAAAAAAGAASASTARQVGYVPPVRVDFEPAAGGNSPLTMMQRRQQREQQRFAAAPPGAGMWNRQRANMYTNQVYEGTPSSTSSGYEAAAPTGVATAAQHVGLGQFDRHDSTADVRYTSSTDTWQTADRVNIGDSASVIRDQTRTYTNSLYQEQQREVAGVTDNSSGSYLTLGRITGAASMGSKPSPGHSNLQHDSFMTPGSTAAASYAGYGAAGGGTGPNSNSSTMGFEAGTNYDSHGLSPNSAAGGLSKIHDDVMGALSLSRYHRERSKQQEARAKQHAMNAQDALDRAAAVRSSRLSGPNAASTATVVSDMYRGAF